MNQYKILVINPGSTSTKVAVYENENELFREEVIHDGAALSKYETMLDQLDMRAEAILEALKKHDFDIAALAGVVGRGGMIPGLSVGAYGVNNKLRQVIRKGNLIPHASNLGALLADAIAQPLGIPAMIYDAVSADNLLEVARITGMPEIRRQSFCHVLNSRAMSRKYAQSQGTAYEDMRLIVAHLGGGISISAHLGGKIIDVVSDDEGPFSPERAGGLPTQSVISLCFDKGYSKAEIMKKQPGRRRRACRTSSIPRASVCALPRPRPATSRPKRPWHWRQRPPRALPSWPGRRNRMRPNCRQKRNSCCGNWPIRSPGIRPTT